MTSMVTDKYRSYRRLRASRFLQISVVILMALLLSTREIPLAADDNNYLDYFSYGYLDNFLNLSVINEPLWRAYSSIIGSVFGDENSLRITIFLGVFLFLDALATVNSKAFLFVFLVFLVSSDLAVQLYFNQIRQGFALAIFLLIAVRFSMPIRGAIVAALFHTSFVVVVVSSLLVWIFRKKPLFIAIAILTAILCLIIFDKYIFSIESLGRRSETYDFVGKLNIKYYIYVIFQYVPIVFLLKQVSTASWRSSYFLHAVFYLFASIIMSIVYEAGGRLMYFVPVFFSILIADNFREQNARFAGYWLVVTLFASALYMTQKVESVDSWVGRWSSIIGL